jgi:RNA recognition motif-containing protein
MKIKLKGTPKKASEEEFKKPKKEMQKRKEVEEGEAPAKKQKYEPKVSAAGQGQNTRTLFIGQLSYNSNYGQVKQHFEDGGVSDFHLRMPTDKTGKHRGIAYIELPDEEAVIAALKMHKTKIDGRKINVQHQKDAKSINADKKAVQVAQVVRRCQGLPLPEDEADAIYAALKALDWKKLGRNRREGIAVDGAFLLGMQTKTNKENNGPYKLLPFKHNTVFNDNKAGITKSEDFWNVASDLMRAIDPNFNFTSIQVNKGFRGSPHRNDQSAGPQYVISVGDYSGGELRIHGNEGVTEVDVNGRYVRFDGRYLHEVTPHTGVRYSIVFYQIQPDFDIDLKSTDKGDASLSPSGGGGGNGTISAKKGTGSKKPAKKTSKKLESESESGSDDGEEEPDI